MKVKFRATDGERLHFLSLLNHELSYIMVYENIHILCYRQKKLKLKTDFYVYFNNMQKQIRSEYI